MKRHKVDHAPVLPVLAPAVDVSRFPIVRRKTISDVECEYRRYSEMVGEDEHLRADVPADVVEGIAAIFAQEALWKNGDGTPFTAGDRSVIATALAQLSKIVPASGS